MKLTNILLKPIITEKLSKMQEQGKYAFYVGMTASKTSIADDVKKVFGVDVVSVRTMILPERRKNIRGTRLLTKKKYSKKAVITLKEGQKIDLYGGQA